MAAYVRKPYLAPGFGARLRAARRAAGLTQEALAEVVGTTPMTLYRWEHERVVPYPLWIGRLAAALRCSAVSLIGDLAAGAAE